MTKAPANRPVVESLPFVTVMTPLDGLPEHNSRLLNVWSSWYKLDYPKDRLKFLFVIPRGSKQKEFVQKNFHRNFEIMETPPVEEPDPDRFKVMARIRETLREKARTSDYGFFLDSDVVPPSDTIRNFVEDAVDIVGGIVVIPGVDGRFQYGFGYFVPGHHFAIKLPVAILTPVGSVNTACMFLSKKVMNDPRVRFTDLVHRGQYGQNLDLSEDHSFCLHAALAGYRVWVDARVECTHLKDWDGRVISLKVDGPEIRASIAIEEAMWRKLREQQSKVHGNPGR